MQLQNPFELIIARLDAIQTKVGDIDTIVRSGNLPPIRKSGKEKTIIKTGKNEQIAQKEGQCHGK